MALLPQPPGIQQPVQFQDAKKVLSTGVWDDRTALNIVLKDADRAENFEATKSWVLGWTTAGTLYQAPVVTRFWEGTQVERANIPFFTLATVVNSLAPQIIKGLFYDDPPFLAQPKPGTSAQVARANAAIIAWQLEEMNIREHLRLGVMNCLLYGTGIWKYGWEVYKKEDIELRRVIPNIKLPSPAGGVEELPSVDEELEEVPTERLVDRPTFENISNLRSVLPDPTLKEPDIRKAKYVVHKMYPTWEELDRLRQRIDIKNLPSREKLLELFFPPKEEVVQGPAETLYPTPLSDARATPQWEAPTEDPFNQPLELIERWDNQRYILVLQRKLVIANTRNYFNEIPFFSIGWWDVPNAFWSMGLAKTIGNEQRLQMGIVNTWLDMLAIMLNGVYTRVKGQSVPTQNLRVSPGKIIDIDKENALMPLQRPQPIPETMQALSMSQARVEQTSGASEFATQGVAGASGHSNLARSAAGANFMASGSGSRVEDFVEKLCNQVVVPYLYKVADMNRNLMPLQTVRYILSDELNHEYIKDKQGDIIDLLNPKKSRMKFTISAAAKMLARRNMAQALPIMMQFLQASNITESLAIEGKKINVRELIRMMFEVSDWKNINDVVVDMTAEDKQRWMATKQAAAAQIQSQGKMALEQQRATNTAQLQDDKNIARAANEVLRQSIEQAATPEEVAGAPGGIGFGANA
jgi:hypothetical protein